MKTLKTLALATAVSAGLLGSVGAMAATDGKLEANSQGQFDIKYIVPGKTAIWGLRDLPFSAAAGGATETETIKAFIWRT